MTLQAVPPTPDDAPNPEVTFIVPGTETKAQRFEAVLALVITCKECWAVLDHPDCTEATMDDWFPRLSKAEEALALELADLTPDLQAQVVGYELADEIDF